MKKKEGNLFSEYKEYVNYQDIDCAIDYNHDYHEGVQNAHNQIIGEYLSDLDRNNMILDCGCGFGFSLNAFRKHKFTNVVGTDISDDRLAIAKKNGHNVKKLDMHNLIDFNNESFDVVYSSHALEHALYPNKVISEIYRVLKNDGIFMLVLPFPVILSDEHTAKAHCGAKYLKLTDSVTDVMLIKTIESFKFRLVEKGYGDYRGEAEIYLKFSKTKEDSLKVLDYGPKSTIFNTGFNIQPNGYSAMWFNIDDLYSSDFIIKYNGLSLKVSKNENILSALIPTFFLSVPGKVEILIFDEEVPDRKASLRFTVENKDLLIKPNFFIIGAPRSGTTSLYWRLRNHYSIHMSRIKEPFYFDKRAHNILVDAICNKRDYLSLFENAPFDTKVIAEASTTYLSSKEALQDIFEFNQESKVLIMLRNPLSAAISMYLQICKGGIYENASTFDIAWKECFTEDRQPYVINYKELYRIGDQLEVALSIFGPKLKVVFYDDLKLDSAAVVRDVLDFLELPIDGDYPLSKTNSAEWSDINSIVSKELLKEMKEYFRPQIEKVSKLTGRNLIHWLDF